MHKFAALFTTAKPERLRREAEHERENQYSQTILARECIWRGAIDSAAPTTFKNSP
jgi:hypothetical protein